MDDPEFGPDCYRPEGCIVATGCKIYCRQPYDNMQTLPQVDRILTADEIKSAAEHLAAAWALAAEGYPGSRESIDAALAERFKSAEGRPIQSPSIKPKDEP